MLQKMIFEKENTDASEKIVVWRENGTSRRFWDFVKRNFEAHAFDLFVTVELRTAAGGWDGSYRYWDTLLADGKARPVCKAVILLQDPYYFRLLDAGRRAGLKGFDGIEANRKTAPDGQRTYELDDALLASLDPIEFDYYFLSGFSRTSSISCDRTRPKSKTARIRFIRTSRAATLSSSPTRTSSTRLQNGHAASPRRAATSACARICSSFTS